MGRIVTERGSRPVARAPASPPSNAGQFQRFRDWNPRSAEGGWGPQDYGPPKSKAPTRQPINPARKMPEPYEPRLRPGRRVPGVVPVVGSVLLADAVLQQLARNAVPFHPPAGFSLLRDCGTRPGLPPYILAGAYIGGGLVQYGGLPFDPLCRSGQSVTGGGANPLDMIVQPATNTLILADIAGVTSSPAGWRGRWDLIWTRPYAWPIPATRVPTRFWWGPYTAVPGGVNPNFLRNATAPSPSAQAPGQAATPAPGARPWQWASGGGPPPLPHARALPRRGTKEAGKRLSLAARIGIAGFKILDTVSELSEIGGAFWDALPPEIRERYNCPDGVSVGQYGLDLNTCKGRAIWENVDKIDTAEAFKNIAKNVVEDMTIGQFHKWLSKLYPPGVSFQRTAATHALSKLDPEAYIAGRLKELWEFLGI